MQLREFCDNCGVACDTKSETVTIRIDEYGNSKVFNLCPNCLKGFLKQQTETEVNFVRNSKWGKENKEIDYGKFQKVKHGKVIGYICPKCHHANPVDLKERFKHFCEKCSYTEKRVFRVGEKYKNTTSLALIEITNIKENEIFYKIIEGNCYGDRFNVTSVFAAELELFEEWKEKQNE